MVDEGDKPKDRRKAKGVLGTTTLSHESGVEFNATALPDTKDKMERFIIDSFDRALDRETREQYAINRFTYVGGGDLDCRVESNNGDFKMELTELVPEGLDKGAGHDAASPLRSVAATADRLLSLIQKKSERYAEKRNPWLLIYFTAWQLADLRNEIIVVRRSLLAQPPQLERIYLLDVTNVAAPELTTIYPMDSSTEGEVAKADIEQVRALHEFRGDPRAWQIKVKKGPGGEDQTVFVTKPFRLKDL